MPWNCYAIKSLRYSEWRDTPGGGRMREMLFTLQDGTEHTIATLPIGAMWHTDMEPEAHYEDTDGPSICVLLPNRRIWYMNHPGTNGCMWKVTGGIPLVTASPSINFVGSYHGWVQNGVITEDCEGRKFS